MARFLFRATTAFSSGILALGMLLTNLVFEALGSVSDFENCGFLAGNVFALFVIYPLISLVIARRTTGRIVLRQNGVAPYSYMGKVIGFAGSLMYFAPGVANLVIEGRTKSLTFELVATIIGMCILCVLFGHLGQISALRKARDNELINSFS